MSLKVLPIPYMLQETLKEKINELNGVILLDGVKDRELQKVFSHFYKGKVKEDEILPYLRHLPAPIKEIIITKQVKPYLVGVREADIFGDNSKEANEKMYQNIEKLLKTKKISDATLLIARKNNFIEYIQKKQTVEAIELSTPNYSVNELSNT